MNKRLIFLPLSILIAFLLYSCDKKCNSNLIGKVAFSQTDLKIVPYSGQEQLLYFDTRGHSVKFTGDYRVAHYSADGAVYVESPNNYYCSGDYYYTEINNTHFVGSDKDSQLFFNLLISNPFSPPSVKSIRLDVEFKDSIIWFFTASYNFDSLKLSARLNSSATIEFKDSLKIGLKVFDSIYVMTQNSKPPGLGYINNVYYSINKGVVGFRIENGRQWYLHSISNTYK